MITGLLLAVALYIAYVILAFRILRPVLAVLDRTRHHENNLLKTAPVSLLQAAKELLFFSRLLSVNPRLWIGEWIFHLSFSLVIIRHLRYALDPVPNWVAALQQPGLWAGYVLPLSLIYVLAVRSETGKKQGSRPGSALLGLILLISLTGLLHHCPVKGFLPLDTSTGVNLVNIKAYVTGVFRFAPGPFPGDGLFSLHFISSLVLLACLPLSCSDRAGEGD